MIFQDFINSGQKVSKEKKERKRIVKEFLEVIAFCLEKATRTTALEGHHFFSSHTSRNTFYYWQRQKARIK
jgi:hypothetical protein